MISKMSIIPSLNISFFFLIVAAFLIVIALPFLIVELRYSRRERAKRILAEQIHAAVMRQNRPGRISIPVQITRASDRSRGTAFLSPIITAVPPPTDDPDTSIPVAL